MCSLSFLCNFILGILINISELIISIVRLDLSFLFDYWLIPDHIDYIF